MDIEALARELKAAQDETRQVTPFTSRVDRFDNAVAYEVARRIHRWRVEGGDVPVGRKIGFTNRGIWEEYKVYEPIWGFVYARTLEYAKGQRVRAKVSRFAEPRLEPEIALCFKTPPPKGASNEEILASLDWIAHSFEIVQTHNPGWIFRAPDTMADNGLHGALFVGPPRKPSELGPNLLKTLEDFTVKLHCNGEFRQQGRGANALDSPISAMRFLLDVLAKEPRDPWIAAGEVVTTGTLTAAYPVKPGEVWHTTLEGIDLPGLTIEFS